jgi:hypothetical protein
MNIGGATDRPVLDEVWKNVQGQLRRQDAAVEKYSRTSVLYFIRQKILG